ncbi:MAG: polysaccharide deacetylase family protein [Gemmatimonadaceae bacterium]|nr:polysaccharide deacetylase family protein [Gloeobacterales cyanobacterium ES-bin-141]
MPDLYDLFYSTLHWQLSRAFPACLWSGDPTRREVALTFDDGPHRRFTPGLLDVLDRYGVKATFFVLGRQVDNTPEIARDIYAAGHWLGLHGYDHQPFLLSEGLKESLERTRQVISSACGLDPRVIRDVRPPYGILTPWTLDALLAWGYRPVMWQVVSDDSLRPGVKVVVERTLRRTGNGALIVLHDGNDGCTDVAEATTRIVERLLAQGYRFVSVEQFWRQRQVALPG